MLATGTVEATGPKPQRGALRFNSFSLLSLLNTVHVYSVNSQKQYKKKLLTFTPCSVHTSRARVWGGALHFNLFLLPPLCQTDVFLFSLWDGPFKPTCVFVFRHLEDKDNETSQQVSQQRNGGCEEEVLKWMCQRDFLYDLLVTQLCFI